MREQKHRIYNKRPSCYFLLTACCLILLGFCITRKEVYAEEYIGNIMVQTDAAGSYKGILINPEDGNQGKLFQIVEYTGDESNHIVPGEVTVDDQKYRTYIGSTSEYSYKEGYYHSPWSSFSGEKLSFEDGIKYGKDLSYMFYGCRAKEIDLSGVATDQATNMSYMFGSSDAKKLDLSGFNTEHVTNMNGMFCACKIEDLDLSGFNTKQVSDMSVMFADCDYLQSVNLSGFTILEPTDISGMFDMTWYITDLNLSHVTTYCKMDLFKELEDFKDRLLYLDLSDFKASKGSVSTNFLEKFSNLLSLRVPKDFNISSRFYNYIGFHDDHGKYYYTLPLHQTQNILLESSPFKVDKNSDVKISIKNPYATGSIIKPELNITINGNHLDPYWGYYDVECSYIHTGYAKALIIFDKWEGYEGVYQWEFTIKQPVKGCTFQKDNIRYKVTSTDKEVEFLGLTKENRKTVVIPDVVKFEKKTYKVTSIGKNALKNNQYVRTVIIGAYVKKIGKNAFAGCKNLGKMIINIKSYLDIKRARPERACSKSTNHGKRITTYIKNKKARKAYRKKKSKRLKVKKGYKKK